MSMVFRIVLHLCSVNYYVTLEALITIDNQSVNI